MEVLLIQPSIYRYVYIYIYIYKEQGAYEKDVDLLAEAMLKDDADCRSAGHQGRG